MVRALAITPGHVEAILNIMQRLSTILAGRLTDLSTDDLFFGPDIDDSAPSQALPESPRMKDFDNIDLDMGDMMNDDSPVKPKGTTPDFASVSSTASGNNSEFPSTPKRSGSFGRSTSSPSLVQTTPTKTTAQDMQRTHGPPPAAPFRATTPFAGLNAFKNAAYTPRSSSPSTGTTSTPQGSASHNSQEGANSTSQNQQNGANSSSRATTPLSSHSGSSASRNSTSAAQSAGAAKTAPANVLRANSLAAANGQHGNNNTNNGSSNAASGFRASTGHNSGAQSYNNYGSNNNQQGQGLKRPFINNG